MQTIKELAYSYFYKAQYINALHYFSLALKEAPEDIDIKLGALLSDYAKEDEGEAIALLDYYDTSKNLGEEESLLYNNIIDSINNTSSSYVNNESMELIFASFENGVEYEDFKKVIKQRDNIKETIENVMFSSKLIINSKEDMVDFIELLMDNDFKDEALTYLESAIMIYPRDSFFEEHFRQLNK